MAHSLIKSYTFKQPDTPDQQLVDVWTRVIAASLGDFRSIGVFEADLMVRPDGRIYLAATDAYAGRKPDMPPRGAHFEYDIMWRIRGAWDTQVESEASVLPFVEPWRRAEHYARNAFQAGTRVTAMARVPGRRDGYDWERCLKEVEPPLDDPDPDPEPGPDGPPVEAPRPGEPDPGCGQCAAAGEATHPEPVWVLVALVALARRRRRS